MKKSSEVKVCHLTSVHRPEDTRIFHKQCISLANAGYEVFLVAHGESYKKKGVNIIGVGEKPTSTYKRFVKSSRKVYEAGKELEADIYHLHDPELLPYALKLKKIGAKVIFDSHEDYISTITEKDYLPTFTRNLIAKAFEKYEKHVIEKIDGAVACYHWTRDRYQKVNQNVEMILNFPIVSDNKLPSHKSNSRKIGFAGGIDYQWCHHEVIKAIEGLDDAQYELAGRIVGDYGDVIKKLSGWEKVNYHGIVPFEDVQKEIYSESSIGICLLDYVAQTKGKVGNLSNTKFFEIMQMGLPIICTDFELWKEIIDEEQCGIYVNPHDINAIQKAINYLFDNRKEASEMGKRGHQAVLEKYNWQEEEEKLFNLYSKI